MTINVVRVRQTPPDTAKCPPSRAPLLTADTLQEVDTAGTYGKKNEHMEPYTHTGDGRFWMCKTCNTNPAMKMLRASWAQDIDSEYMEHLIRPGLGCLAMQNLSFINCQVQMANKFMGFAHGSVGSGNLFNSPFITWRKTTAEQDEQALKSVLPAVMYVLAANVLHNPLFHKWLTVYERLNPKVGFAAISGDVMRRFLKDAQQRGPAGEHVLEELLDETLGLMEDTTRLSTDHLAEQPACNIGSLYLRQDADVEARPPEDLVVGPNGLQDLATNVTTPAVEGFPLTAESANFPFLFPTGDGWFGKSKHGKGVTLATYLHYRMLCSFSVFTMYKPYLLLMYQLRQAVVACNSITVKQLERDIAKYKQKHPGCSEKVRVG